MKKTDYDVIVLGAGISGSLTALILARRGLRVLMVDKDVHPRFALGESTITVTSLMLDVLALRFGVPELRYLSSSSEVFKHVSPSCGVKRQFGFVYHGKPGARRPGQTNLVGVARASGETETHLFRQDVDAYLYHLAIASGVDVRTKAVIERIEISDSVVEVTSSKGEFRAAFIIDGSGSSSLLARKMGILDVDPPTRTRTRTIYTHLVGVKPFEHCIGDEEPRTRWSEGTLHHLFEGGWMWVIPFNNHPESRNPLCSVGLSLDVEKYPQRGSAGEQEFKEFIARYPSVAEQFRDARPVRDWVATGRLQYAASRCVGKRFALTSHTAGAIDALFSRGLSNVTWLTAALVPRVLAAVGSNDFDVERFEYVDRLQKGLLDYNDMLVHGAYTSFASDETWNAWFRVWALSSLFGVMQLNHSLLKFVATRNPAVFNELDDCPFPGALSPDHEGMRNLFVAAYDVLGELARGAGTPEVAGRRIFELLTRAPFLPPPLRLDDPHTRLVDSTPELLRALVQWGKTAAPPDIRERYFDVHYGPLEPPGPSLQQ